jgi:hypothetical protein
MKGLLCAVLAVALCATGDAQVVRPAPSFQVEGAGKGVSLRSFRGQAVVLLITRSARQKEFRAMVERLGEMYGQFSTEKVLFVAAIEEGPQAVLSNIPFMIASDPQQLAADYGVRGRYAIAVIGVDGNLDMITNRLIAAERVRDVVFNNFESQTESRKPLGP